MDGTDCTAKEMRNGLEHSLGGLGIGVVDNNPSKILVSNKVWLLYAYNSVHYKIWNIQNVTQFKQELDFIGKSGNVKSDIFLNIGYVYDALWTVVLALNSSISLLNDRGLGKLENFTYDSSDMADIFVEAITNVSFQGISVSGSYNWVTRSIINFMYKTSSLL